LSDFHSQLRLSSHPTCSFRRPSPRQPIRGIPLGLCFEGVSHPCCHPVGTYVKFTHWSLTEALLRAGDEQRAAEEIERFVVEVGANRRLRIPYLRSRAILAAWRQEPKQAIAYLEEALTLADEIGLPGEVGQMQAKLSELYPQMVQKGQAQQAR
jgi:tetratricopeptide (TPR) repeat protein